MTRTADDDQVSEHVLVALADPIRREVLAMLAREGGATSTSSLAVNLPVTRQAVAKHLAVLDRAGLVRAHRIGREVRYEADLPPLKQTTRWMATLATQWEHRLNTIKALAEGAAGP